MPEAKLVLHHDDSPCEVRLTPSGDCPTCGFTPDMQSTCFWYYCPTCDKPLKKMACATCKKKFTKPA